MTSGFIISAPASGSGKTIITLALLRAYKQDGCLVSSLKIGPDYIDPGFHTLASGSVCRNFDIWAMRPQTLDHQLAAAAAGADLVIAEGVMGLFDGALDGTGSTADAARRLGWPVVLVVDVHAQAASAAAVVSGFSSFRADVAIAGVIFNRVGGPRHREILTRAMADSPVPVLGYIPRSKHLELPDRHLGLVQATELADIEHRIDQAAALIQDNLEMTKLAALAVVPRRIEDADPGSGIEPPGTRIAVARDDAFTFCYPHLLDDWKRASASVSFFSPLADETPGEDADAIYLPGGYPELYAAQLSSNALFLDGLRRAAGRGAIVWGECGGFMVLGDTFTDSDDQMFSMAGLLPVQTQFGNQKLHLGYRALRLCGDGPLGQAGTEFRGHEFHYSTQINDPDADALFEICDAQGDNVAFAGCRRNNVMGSYVHLIDRHRRTNASQPANTRSR